MFFISRLSAMELEKPLLWPRDCCAGYSVGENVVMRFVSCASKQRFGKMYLNDVEMG